jgi:hypothetical protein
VPRGDAELRPLQRCQKSRHLSISLSTGLAQELTFSKVPHVP